MTTKRMYVAFVVMILLATACQPAIPEPVDVPAATSTMASTSTPLPTNTPVPTNTSTPTKTPIPPTATVPAPDKVSEYLDNVKVISIDTFDKNTGLWWLDSAGTFKDGGLEIIGKDWNGIGREGILKEGKGVIIDFTFTRGSVFEIFFDKGDWWTDSYRRYGVYVYNSYPAVNVWSGKNGLGGAYLSGNFSTKPETTYSLMIAILPNGEFLSVIWDPSDPSKTIRYRENIGETWSNISWNFRIGADKGTILFDNYRVISFDGVK